MLLHRDEGAVSWAVPFGTVAGIVKLPPPVAFRLAGSRVILHPARLLPWKGVHTTVEAFASLAERFPDVALVITTAAGEGIGTMLFDFLFHEKKALPENERARKITGHAQKDIGPFLFVE